jgi:hypothetical protein
MNNLNLIYDSIESYIKILEEKQRESIKNNIERMKKRLESPEASAVEVRFLPERIKSAEDSIERDIFFWKLGLKYKLFVSLTTYIQETDIISDVTLDRNVKGLEITCNVTRDGVAHSFNTRAIEAGGYDIQCFHYRYITKTTLPKTEDKKTNKLFKLNEELDKMEYYLNVSTQLNNVNNINHYNRLIEGIKNKIELLKQ